MRRGRGSRNVDEDKPRLGPHGLSGGAFRPLSDGDLARTHETALELLADLGLSQATPSMIELVRGRGGRLTDERVTAAHPGADSHLGG